MHLFRNFRKPCLVSCLAYLLLMGLDFSYPLSQSAAAVTDCTVGGSNCLGNGNDTENKVLDVVNDHLLLNQNPITNLVLLGKSDNAVPYGNVIGTTFMDGTEPIGGTWNSSGVSVSFISIKADGGFKVWDVMGATSGSWDTLGFGNNPPQALSHIAFWDGGASPPSPVPVPAAGFLFGTGLGSIAWFQRTRSENQFSSFTT